MSLLMNRPEIIRALSNIFSLKGKLGFVLDETIVPTINAGDLARTPYLQFPRPFISPKGVTAGAATLGISFIRPAANKIIQVSKVLINNTPAAANSFELRILTATQIATLTPVNSKQLVDVGAERAGTLMGSTHTTSVIAALVGTELIGRIDIPASSSVQIDLPSPSPCLYGNDEGGIPGIGVFGKAFLQALDVVFFGREWPLPGQ